MIWWDSIIIFVFKIIVLLLIQIPLLIALLILFYPRFRSTGDYDDPSLEGFEHVQFKATSTCCSVSIKGWWKPPRKESNGIVICVHGNRQSFTRIYKVTKTSLYESLGKPLSKAGFGVLGIDIRNHGDSGYMPPFAMGNTEKWDVKAAINFVQKKCPSAKIGIYGVSLGTQHSIHAASLPGVNIHALVIESAPCAFDTKLLQTWASAPGRNINIPKWYLWIFVQLWKILYFLVTCSFWKNSIDVAGLVRCPVLHFHGTADLVVPFECSKRLEKVFKNRKGINVKFLAEKNVPSYKCIPYNGGHTSAFIDLDGWLPLLVSYFEKTIQNN